MYILTGVGVSRYDDCVEYYKKFGMDNLQNRIIEVIDDLQKAFTAQAPEDEADLEAKPEHVSMWCIAVYIDVYVVYLTTCVQLAGAGRVDKATPGSESQVPNADGRGGEVENEEEKGEEEEQKGHEKGHEVRNTHVYLFVCLCACILMCMWCI
jgi:hypothetical protein